MTDQIQIADFDLDISEVLLVHKNTFVHLFKWSEYRGGRGFDGLSYCVSGRAEFSYNDSSFELNPGQAVFLPACASYTVRCVSDEPFVHYTVNFRLDREKLARESNANTAFYEILAGKMRYLTAAQNSDIYSIPLEKLLSVWLSKGNGYRVMAKAIIYELLYLYFTDARRSCRDKAEYARLLPARRELDARYAENIDIPELAALCEMSETNFRRLFTRLFGMPPTEYRLNKRILRAKDLLLSGQYSVKETAREVGFHDANYFTRVFREKVGMSPSEFIM